MKQKHNVNWTLYCGRINRFAYSLWFFYLEFSVRQDYSAHFEPSQGVKIRDPQEKKLDHPQAELGLPHMWPELGSNSQQ